MRKRLDFNVILMLWVACLFGLSPVYANGSGHSQHEELASDNGLHDHAEDHGTSFISKVGVFHPLAVHFPIALLMTTLLAEGLYLFWPRIIFQHSARFMLVAGAVSAIPTVALGLAHAYDGQYGLEVQNIVWWHRLFGISVAILACTSALIKERSVRGSLLAKTTYPVVLVLTNCFVLVTGYLGGEVTFGIGHLFP